jgi:hypothetical protein
VGIIFPEGRAVNIFKNICHHAQGVRRVGLTAKVISGQRRFVPRLEVSQQSLKGLPGGVVLLPAGEVPGVARAPGVR